MSRVLLALVAFASLAAPACPAAAQSEPRVLEITMKPVRRAQIAVWIERADGTFLRTLALTHAVAERGIGNRPGASQMNSGYHWPYGRREGVLPVWAHRRASAPGAQPFRRVIFQDRASEGYASRTTNDFSVDDYYCLSFQEGASRRDALDAVSCPSTFNSDKGRYMTEADRARGYSEPFETSPGAGVMMPLSLESLYPPRRDVRRCTSPGCYDHPDVDLYASDVRRIMPEIDAVSMATPPGEQDLTLMFTLPEDWEDGEYVVWIEVNTEGDYNSAWGPSRFPTPRNPSGTWDSWAINYGYPYRGQPSVVWRLPITVTRGATVASATEPFGYGSIDGRDGGVIHAMDETITDDPNGSPGSGADRLMREGGGDRVTVRVLGPELCEDNSPPGAIEGLTVTPYAERRSAHRWAHLSFVAPQDDFGVARYEVRVSTDPIVDEETFLRGLQAQAASLENEALVVPTSPRPGETIEVDFGGLAPERRYYVGVRAVDLCNAAGEIAATEYTTPPIEFTTVSPCFVATAAWGTPMAEEIGALRRLRDRHLRTNALGRAFVRAYEAVGPHLADAIRDDEDLRALARALLAPFVALARSL
ncbi:MAG TPA: CFI-box-CTERM domain-containing protein [Sandaracinaceae bacterium]